MGARGGVTVFSSCLLPELRAFLLAWCACKLAQVAYVYPSYLYLAFRLSLRLLLLISLAASPALCTLLYQCPSLICTLAASPNSLKPFLSSRLWWFSPSLFSHLAAVWWWVMQQALAGFVCLIALQELPLTCWQHCLTWWLMLGEVRHSRRALDIVEGTHETGYRCRGKMSLHKKSSFTDCVCEGKIKYGHHTLNDSKRRAVWCRPLECIHTVTKCLLIRKN